MLWKSVIPGILFNVVAFSLILGFFLGLFLVPIHILRKRARQHGYLGLMDYLRELPQTDEQKLDAAELALKGLVLCALSLLFPPLVVIGLVPLYYGLRKLAAVALAVPSTKPETQDGHWE